MPAAALSRLLERLDPDADRAAAAYEQLRRTLERFFDWQGAWPPEECADETLDRLARKLDGDAGVQDVRRYARGIARMVLLEWRRRPRTVSIEDGPEPAGSPPPPGEDDAALHDCLDNCLQHLPADSRRLVLEYYTAETRAKIENRRRLAEALSLTDNALRSRVQRVRDRLERCVRSCMQEQRAWPRDRGSGAEASPGSNDVRAS